MEKQLKLNLHYQEVEFIMNALGELPYRQSFQLIDKLNSQIKSNLENGQTQPMRDKDFEEGFNINVGEDK